MMSLIDFTPLAKALLEVVVTVCSVLITSKIIPFIKSKLKDNELELVKIVVKMVVNAAEQIFEVQDGAAKKEYALERIQAFLEEKGIVLDITVLDAMIESAVLELHRRLAE